MKNYKSLIVLLLTGTAICPVGALANGDEGEITLAPIYVEGQSDGSQILGYQVQVIRSVTRTATPLQSTPQSVQIIPSELISDQQPTTMAEVLRNVSGAQGNIPLQTPAFESTLLRGFPAEYYRDGITNYINTGDANSLGNIDRIEVLKGPNAILYGGGIGTPLGGVVNIVTKKPQSEDFSTFGLTVGSHSHVQPSLDINRKISDDVAFRMNGSYTKSRSDVEVVQSDRYTFAPAISIDKGDTRLLIQGYLSRWQAQEYQGLPAVGTVTGDFRLNRDLYIGDPSIPDSTTSTRNLTFTLSHDFNENWAANGQFQIGRNKVEQITQIITSNTPDAGPRSWNLYNSYVPGKQTQYSLNASLTGKLQSGDIEHTLVFGTDFSRIKDYSLMYMDYAGSVDLMSPAGWPSWVKPSTLAMGEGNGRYTTAGAYAQWQVDAGRWHFLTGARLAYLQTVYDSKGYSRSDTLDDTRLLPRFGTVYDITKQLSAFASYSEGMKANAFYFYSDTPKPEYSKQAEVGLKLDTGAWQASLAAFQINRRNVPVTDPNDPMMLTSLTEGQQRSRGVEADVVWQPGGAWRVMANYAYTDAELTADVPNGAPAGNRLGGVPRHSGGLWVDYNQRSDDGEGWRAGAGIYAASSAYIDLANQYKTSGYAVVNTSASYTMNGTTFEVAVKNLMDREYDLPFYGYMGGRVAPASERQIFVSISKSF